MFRKTSAIVFDQIQKEGLLKGMQLEACRILVEIGPATAGEIAQRSKSNRNNVARTLSILRDKKAVKEVGERQCKVTGRVVIVWDLVDVPHALDTENKPKLGKDEAKAAYYDLRKIIKNNPQLLTDNITNLGRWLKHRAGV